MIALLLLQFHYDEDRSKYCSLTAVRRYAYVISDFCCSHYHLKLLPNRHCPADIVDEGKYEIIPKAEPTPAQVCCSISLSLSETNCQL